MYLYKKNKLKTYYVFNLTNKNYLTPRSVVINSM